MGPARDVYTPPMRSISVSQRPPKVRNLPRHVRAVGRWADGFEGFFPPDLSPDTRYWNEKLPVFQPMVEGPRARRWVQRACASHLITACHHLIQAKPASAKGFRVVASVVLPQFFGSELCVYTDEAYFQSKIRPRADAQGSITPITGRSLAAEWGLTLPQGIGELGALWDYSARAEDPFKASFWIFGEVD